MLSQNVGGFKKSERRQWLEAWRGEVREKRRDIYMLQETHVTSATEVRELNEMWNRVWGEQDTTRTTTFWGLARTRAAGVAILVNPKTCREATEHMAAGWTDRHVAAKVRDKVYVNVYAPNTRTDRE